MLLYNCVSVSIPFPVLLSDCPMECCSCVTVSGPRPLNNTGLHWNTEMFVLSGSSLAIFAGFYGDGPINTNVFYKKDAYIFHLPPLEAMSLVWGLGFLKFPWMVMF